MRLKMIEFKFELNDQFVSPLIQVFIQRPKLWVALLDFGVQCWVGYGPKPHSNYKQPSAPQCFVLGKRAFAQWSGLSLVGPVLRVTMLAHSYLHAVRPKQKTEGEHQQIKQARAAKHAQGRCDNRTHDLSYPKLASYQQTKYPPFVRD